MTYVATRTKELLEKQIQNELKMEPGSEKIISLNGLTIRVRNTLHVTGESWLDSVTGDSLTVSSILAQKSK